MGLNMKLHHMLVRGSRLLFVLACLMGLAFASAAQTNNATVTGVVTDQTGATVPGAKVTATNTQTGIQKSGTSDDSGRYTVLDLTPGTYDIQVAQPGFATMVRRAQELLVGTTVSLDFSLQVSAVGQQVEVTTSEAALMQTTQSTVARILETNELDNLPVLNRQFSQLAILTPGVISSGSSYGGTGSLTTATVSIGNAPLYETGYVVDGISNEAGNQGYIFTSMAQDWIQEFSVLALQFPAEYASAAGGVVNVSTRSGTNNFHGRVYMLYQNDVFNANPDFYTGTTKAPFSSERGGVMVGGPIKKDKLFFFAGYERFHNVQTNSISSQLTGNAAFVAKDQPIGTPKASLVPWLPYGPLTPTAVINDNDLAMLKFDYTPNATNSFIMRLNLEYEYGHNGGFGGATSYGNATTQFIPSYAVNLGWTRTISSNTINELRFGYYAKRSGQSCSNFGAAVLPYTGGVTNPYNYFNTSAFGGLTESGNPAGLQAVVTYVGFNTGSACGGPLNAETLGLITDSLTHTVGKHDIKIGGMVKRLTLWSNNGNFGYPNGTYTFAAGASPFNPATPIPQASPVPVPADFTAALKVAPNNDFVDYGLRSYNFPSKAFGLFAQDTWKVNSNLTFNIGVRYDFNDTNSALHKDSFPALQAVRPGSQGFVQPGWNFVNNDPLVISPRIGFAWTPFHDNKRTLLRGGTSIFYDQNDTALQAVYIETNPEGLFDYALTANAPTLNPYCTGNATCANGVPVVDEIAVVDVLAAALSNYTLPQFPISTSPCAATNSCTVTVGGHAYTIPALPLPYNPQGGQVNIPTNYKNPGTFQATGGIQRQQSDSLNFAVDFVYHYGFNQIAAWNPNLSLTGQGATSTYTVINPAYSLLREEGPAAFYKNYQLDAQVHYRDHRGDSLQVAYQLGWAWDDAYNAGQQDQRTRCGRHKPV